MAKRLLRHDGLAGDTGILRSFLQHRDLLRNDERCRHIGHGMRTYYGIDYATRYVPIDSPQGARVTDMMQRARAEG